ncbi:MAG: thermonuclease family protein, partial [Candidatus Aenigmatarchaeota archaeon]
MDDVPRLWLIMFIVGSIVVYRKAYKCLQEVPDKVGTIATYQRKPAKILDGDTFKLHKTIQGKKFVRLAGVSTPERGQSGFEKARNQLRGMVGGKRVTIKPVDIGRRVIAHVIADGESVNRR